MDYTTIKDGDSWPVVAAKLRVLEAQLLMLIGQLEREQEPTTSGEKPHLSTTGLRIV